MYIRFERISGRFCAMDRIEAEKIYESGKEDVIQMLLHKDAVIVEQKRRLGRIAQEVSRWKKGFCYSCFEKQERIDKLEQEVQHLKAKMRYREQKETEGYFGSSTPSAKRPFKENSSKENQNKQGGAKRGHKGNGRYSITEEEADRIEEIPLGDTCPHCGGGLQDKGISERTVMDIKPVIVEKTLYRLHQKYCPTCKKFYRAKAPSVLPKHLFGNQLIAQTAVMHYVHGIPMGRIKEHLGVDMYHMYGTFHWIARFFNPGIDFLTGLYRLAPAKHADETGWRTDGLSGYAWLFCTQSLSIYKIRRTRSALIPQEVFGTKKLPGTLTVDRYNAYNRVPCNINYCYSHLHREVTDLDKEFPNCNEVQLFIADFGTLLAQAMNLHTQKISDSQYYKSAHLLQEKIIQSSKADANHLGIRRIQEIFRENEHRLYHWVTDRRVAPDNNFCEQELRCLVTARKVSFGSQSENGAKTREILMSMLHSLKKNTNDVVAAFKEILDKIAYDPSRNPVSLLKSYFDTS